MRAGGSPTDSPLAASPEFRVWRMPDRAPDGVAGHFAGAI